MDKLKTPPKNTLHVNRWTELPNCLEPAQYCYSKDGKEVYFTTSKKARQVLEGLMQRPIACASKCRISHYVSVFKRDHGLEIHMTMYRPEGNTPQGGESFGVYTLKSNIERVSDKEAA